MTQTDAVDRLLREAIAALDRAVEQPVDQLVEEAGAALRAMVRLRDALLEDRRRDLAAQTSVSTQSLLDAVNAALSCASGVAYPGNKLERDGLRQARDALARLSKSS